jgi:hypothetical protein
MRASALLALLDGLQLQAFLDAEAIAGHAPFSTITAPFAGASRAGDRTDE